MKITDKHVDDAIGAYEWVSLYGLGGGSVEHAVVEWVGNSRSVYHGVIGGTLCGRSGAAGGPKIQRCGTCLNVIYARLGVVGIAT